MTRIQHKYILYVFVPRLNRHCEVVAFNALEKVKKFLTEAKKYKNDYWNPKSTYYISRTPHGADLDNYYIRHVKSKIEITILKDEVLENDK